MNASSNMTSLADGERSDQNWPAGANDAQEQLNAMNSHGARIQLLLGQIEALPTPSTRQLIHEFMEATLAFYGQGLARILQVVSESGPASQNVYQHLIDDKVVRGSCSFTICTQRISRLACAMHWIMSVPISRVTAATWN
jgi:hypothetical protein